MTTRSAAEGRRWQRLVVLAVVAGLGVRLVFGLGYWRGKPMTHDEREYLALAANLAAGRGLVSDLPGEPAHPLADRFGRAPLYPLFLAPLVSGNPDLRAGRLPPEVPVPVKVAQAILGAWTIVLAAAIARRVAGGRAAALTALGVAFYPSLVWICAYALTEAFYAWLALLTAWTLGAIVDRGRGPGPEAVTAKAGDIWRVLGAGVLAGLAVLTRPATLAFLPLAAIWLAWRHRGALALCLLAGTLVVVSPWTARNWIVHGRFVLVASEGGVTFWTGNHPLAIGEGDLAANPAIKRANLELRARHPGLSPEELEPIYYREALRWMAREPGAWLRLMLRKAFYLVVPVGPSYRLHSPLYFWASVVPYLVVLPVALAGAWRMRHGPAQPRALWLLAASVVIVSLVFFPQERFRIPVIDPTLVVTAALRLAAASDRIAVDRPA